MSLVFVRSDLLPTVHERLIGSYGGLQGIRSDNGLESAVAGPRQFHNYTGESRVGAIAASLAWALLRNYPFTDGNKRTALAAFVMSAQLNGHRLRCSEAEETAMILKAAGAEISEEEWIAWALCLVVPK
jgi:death-on-curing protein